MRLPRFWHGDAEPEQVRWNLGRGGALARGMREAATRDGMTSQTWQPGPVPRPRQARKQERDVQQRQASPDRYTDRAKALARATQQQARGRTR